MLCVVVLTIRDRERERETLWSDRGERWKAQCSPLVQGRGAWDVEMKWEAPLQEVAPQHEGRHCTPPNEGWSGAPCGTPSGTFIRRWKSVSRSRASLCLGLDMFNFCPHDETVPLSKSDTFKCINNAQGLGATHWTTSLLRNIELCTFYLSKYYILLPFKILKVKWLDTSHCMYSVLQPGYYGWNMRLIMGFHSF